MRRKIAWKVKREDGTCYEVRVNYFGGKYTFQFCERTEERWDYQRAPAREDLEMLYDHVKRRYQRRLASQDEIHEAKRLLDAM